MARLLVEINTTVDRARHDGATGLHPDLLARHRTRHRQLIEAGWTANPNSPARHTTKRCPAVNLLDRLDTHRDDVLRFAASFAVPFTNNTAETDIRMVKIRQKISGGLRTMNGARIFCALRSYLSTARKRPAQPDRPPPASPRSALATNANLLSSYARTIRPAHGRRTGRR